MLLRLKLHYFFAPKTSNFHCNKERRTLVLSNQTCMPIKFDTTHVGAGICTKIGILGFSGGHFAAFAAGISPFLSSAANNLC